MKIQNDYVNLEIMFPDQNFILEVRPKNDPGLVFKWLENNLSFIEKSLLDYCGIVFRGFSFSQEEFQKISDLISTDESLDYTAGIAPREKHSTGVYLSTTIDKRCEIPQHHEMSYFRNWPMKIFFYCAEPSLSGGETTLVSTRTFHKRLDPAILNKFEKKEVAYVRNYIEGINSSWQKSYDTTDKGVVEDIVRNMGFEFQWNGEKLKTKNVAQGVAFHPFTKEKVWHNHAHVYNLFCGKQGELTPTLKMAEVSFGPEKIKQLLSLEHTDLPTNTYYGDGSIIEHDVIEEICEIFSQEKVGFIWEKGDFMVLDNMLCFHGKNPHEGDDRKILAIMKEKYPSYN